MLHAIVVGMAFLCIISGELQEVCGAHTLGAVEVDEGVTEADD
jgi:hypothetical protein